MTRPISVHQISDHLDANERDGVHVREDGEGGELHVLGGGVVRGHDSVVLGAVVQRVAGRAVARDGVERRQGGGVREFEEAVILERSAGDDDAAVVEGGRGGEDDGADGAALLLGEHMIAYMNGGAAPSLARTDR